MTAECSVGEVMISLLIPSRPAKARPLITVLFASVQEPVKVIRRAVQLSRRARLRRADSTATFASLPSRYMLEGLPGGI
jgi:hypothetical protein